MCSNVGKNRRAHETVDCKIVMLGRHSVGKTSLSERYLHGEFNVKSTATIGAAFRCGRRGLCCAVFSPSSASQTQRVVIVGRRAQCKSHGRQRRRCDVGHLVRAQVCVRAYVRAVVGMRCGAVCSQSLDFYGISRSRALQGHSGRRALRKHESHLLSGREGGAHMLRHDRRRKF